MLLVCSCRFSGIIIIITTIIIKYLQVFVWSFYLFIYCFRSQCVHGASFTWIQNVLKVRALCVCVCVCVCVSIRSGRVCAALWLDELCAAVELLEVSWGSPTLARNRKAIYGGALPLVEQISAWAMMSCVLWVFLPVLNQFHHLLSEVYRCNYGG